MNRSPEHKPTRGQWMTTEGREVYHAWLAEALSKSQARGVDFSELEFNSNRFPDDINRNNESRVMANLSTFAAYMTNRIMEQSNDESNYWQPKILIDSANSIIKYTSVDDWIAGKPYPQEVRNAIDKHTEDGIDFATRVTMGLAYDAYRAMTDSTTNDQKFYDKISEIMHDSSFQQTLEQFSTTGFAVLRGSTRRAMLAQNTAHRVGAILEIRGDLDRIVYAQTTKDGGHVFYLNPKVATALIDQLGKQNTEHRLNHEMPRGAISQHIAERSFTTGCPVRKAPKSEIAKGNDKSGIALLSEYLGKQLTIAARQQFAQKDLAATARKSAHVYY